MGRGCQEVSAKVGVCHVSARGNLPALPHRPSRRARGEAFFQSFCRFREREATVLAVYWRAWVDTLYVFDAACVVTIAMMEKRRFRRVV